jgi:quercetin dioxygenase-like cupin family protein
MTLGRAIIVADPRAVQLRPSYSEIYDREVSLQLLYMDPRTAAEHYVVSYPAGLRTKPHRHSAAHTIVVLEGRLRVNDQVIGRGGYAHLPAGETMVHAPDGDAACVSLFMFDGPSDAQVVSEA